MDTETLVHRFVDAYNSRELDVQMEMLFDPGVEFVPMRAALENVVYRGHDGIRQIARDLAESWSQAQIEICELEVRGQQAVSIGRVRLKGRSSGALTEATGVGAFVVRNKRLIRVAYHQTVEDARRDLGWET